MNTTEKSKVIRETIKKELGLNSRHVAVKTDNYSMGSSINLNIKSMEAYENMDRIKEIAEGQEKIRRCEYSMEILSGGNTFVFVRVEENVKREVASKYKDEIVELMDRTRELSDKTTGESSTINGVEVTMFYSGHSFEVYMNGRYLTSVWDGEESWVTIGLNIEKNN